MNKSIDLGCSLKDEIGNAVPISADDVRYPELHISDREEARLLELPDEGTAEIKFKVVRRHHSEDNGEGKKKRHTCSVTLEVHSISVPENGKNGKKKTHWEMFNGG